VSTATPLTPKCHAYNGGTRRAIFKGYMQRIRGSPHSKRSWKVQRKENKDEGDVKDVLGISLKATIPQSESRRKS